MSPFNPWNLYDEDEVSTIDIARMYKQRFPNEKQTDLYILIEKMSRHIEQLSEQSAFPKCSCKDE